MTPPGIRESEHGGALWWTLDHPRRRNAIGPDALRWIAQRARSLAGQTVVLTGAGDEAFCAGFDLTALGPVRDGPPPDAPLMEATAAMDAADATFIAAINGFAIGAGLELACACDFRVAREDAWFAVPAAKLGVVYHAAGLRRLHAVLGPTVCRRLLLLGERVDAEGLAEAGALTEVTAPASLGAATQAMIEALGRGAPLSQRAHRAFFRALQRGGPTIEEIEEHTQARDTAYAGLEHSVAKPEPSG